MEYVEKYGEFSIISDGEITVKMGMRPILVNLWFGDSKPGIQEVKKLVIARHIWVNLRNHSPVNHSSPVKQIR